MDRTALLEDIARALNDHEDSIRIRKLLFLSCTGQWEGNPQKVAALDLKYLVDRLQSLAPSHKALVVRLERAAAYLNKPVVYGRVAETIADSCGPLYNHAPARRAAAAAQSAPSPESTGPQRQGQFGSETPTVASDISASNRAAPPQPAPQPANDRRDGCDWFALRFEVLKAANPLRVKILTFFTLNANTSFNAYTWASIKSEMLDRLLFRLFKTCPTLEALDAQLKATVERFPEVEEYAQTADAILRVMGKMLYKNDVDVVEDAAHVEGERGRFPGFELFERMTQENTQISLGSGAIPDADREDDEEEARSILVVENAFSPRSSPPSS